MVVTNIPALFFVVCGKMTAHKDAHRIKGQTEMIVKHRFSHASLESSHLLTGGLINVYM